jgi:phospholipid/cholesterol/gamma-HCH transport system substrate-binding protein
METRARYALIGLFMLAVILASFGFVYWLENKGGFAQRSNYNVRFEGSVSGLIVGSAVLFNGLRVGEVTGLTLDPAQPNQVVATIAVERGTPVRGDTHVGIEQQGLTGGAAVTLRGGSATAPVPEGEGGAPPLLLAQPGAGQDWTQSARDAFQRVDNILAENSEALHSAIGNIDTFSEALARNADKVDTILAGLERMTGGAGGGAKSPLYDLAAVEDFPPPPEPAPSWQLVVPEPSTLMGLNTDKILVKPAPGQIAELPNAKWSDNLPVLVQAKLIQSFENAGYVKSVSRPRDAISGGYQLLIDIRSFFVATSSQPKAEIELVARIVDADGKPIGARDFKAEAPSGGSDAQHYVSAFDDAFAKVVQEVLEWTVATLNAAPPPAPAAEAPPEPPAADAPPEPPADDMAPEVEMPPEPEAPGNTP